MTEITLASITRHDNKIFSGDFEMERVSLHDAQWLIDQFKSNQMVKFVFDFMGERYFGSCYITKIAYSIDYEQFISVEGKIRSIGDVKVREI